MSLDIQQSSMKSVKSIQYAPNNMVIYSQSVFALSLIVGKYAVDFFYACDKSPGRRISQSKGAR